MINWEDLFKRYVSHVSNVEGTHFLHGFDCSVEERDALDRIVDAEENSWRLGGSIADRIVDIVPASTPFLEMISKKDGK